MAVPIRAIRGLIFWAAVGPAVTAGLATVWLEIFEMVDAFSNRRCSAGDIAFLFLSPRLAVAVAALIRPL